jgi:dolichyl-phosphate-mannose-protein mannosyltransferase
MAVLGQIDRDDPRRNTFRDPRWPPTLIFLAGLVAAIVIRIPFLNEPGLTGDLDQFVLWVHGIATGPFGHAYDMDISFPPVMVYIWSVLAAVEPAFRTVTTSADVAVRIFMKMPATFADLLLGLLVAWHLRATPWWAIVGSFLILFHPAVIDVSAWWGQYESIYVLVGAIAFVLAVRGHSLFAAVALAVALMTKPQALPFLVPFAAWFLARDGWLGAAKAAAVGAATIVVIWLPFLAAGGVQNYLHTLSTYQGDVYAILSLRAWNLWWLVQELLAGGSFVSDQGAIVGPITLRHVGYGLALLGELAVFVLVYRARSPRALAFGLAAAVLVAFCFLTTMHERYAFGVLVFLPLAFPDRRAYWLAGVFGLVFTLNLLTAIPLSPAIGAVLPATGPLAIAGSITMLAILAALFVILRQSAAEATEPVDTLGLRWGGP